MAPQVFVVMLQSLLTPELPAESKPFPPRPGAKTAAKPVEKPAAAWPLHAGLALYTRVIAERGNHVILLVTEAETKQRLADPDQQASLLEELKIPEFIPIHFCECVLPNPSTQALFVETLIHDMEWMHLPSYLVSANDADAEIARLARLTFLPQAKLLKRPINWEIRDGYAIRPSDGRFFTVDIQQTSIAPLLRTNNFWESHAAKVRVVRAWGKPDDELPQGEIEISFYGSPWAREDGVFTLG